MKSIVFNRLFFYLLVLTFINISCDSDDDISDILNPEVSGFMSNISTAPGVEFKFEGKITDNEGIASVNIYYSDWFIDKVIVFNEIPKEYTLNYKFLVPEDAIPNTSHTIKVGITDVGGNTITIDVLVTLDLDVTNPELVFTQPLAGSNLNNGDLMSIIVDVTDDFGLASLQIKSEALGLDEMANVTGGETTFNYTGEIEIPEGIEGAIMIEAIATDEGGNTSTATTTVLIGSSAQYTDMYLVGGSVWWEWDPSKATKMWQDPNDENWFVCEFYYWTGYDVKFIGQLGWEPNNWGLDPNDNTQMINAQDSETIGFPDGDGYYRIKFNPYSLEYSYEKMTVDVAERDNMYLMGKGFVGYGLDWNPADAIPMQKDGWGWGNPYMFVIEIEFSDSVDLKFIGQNDGWGPYDCGFEVGGEMTLPLNYVKNACGDGTADVKFNGQAGWYWIVYDYFLQRTTIHPSE